MACPRASTAIRLGQGLGTSPGSDKARSSGSSAWGASISSAGQGRIAIEVAGLPSPQRIKTIIDDRRAAARRVRA